MEFFIKVCELERVEIIQQVPHLLVYAAGLVQILRGQLWCGKGSGSTFEHRDGLHGFEVHRLVVGGNPGAHVALVGDQTFGLELPDSLTYWNDADLQCIGDGREHQAVSGFILAGADLLPNPRICLLRFGLIT